MTASAYAKEYDDVLIVGGGMSGLLLAQGLKHRNIPFQLYERDPGLISRGHRYRIQDAGIEGCKSTLSPAMWELFEKTHAGRIEPPVLALIDAATGQRIDTWDFKIPRSVNIDRPWVRELLMTGIEDRVHFGKAFEKYELSFDEEGSRQGAKVTFSDGSTAEGRIVIGVDGVNSKIRQQMFPGTKLLDVGMTCVWGRTTLNDEFRTRFGHEEILKEHFAVALDKQDPTQSCLFAPIEWPDAGKLSKVADAKLSDQEDYLFWVVSFPTPSEDTLLASLEDRKAYCLERTRSWDASLRTIIEMQSQSVAHPIYSSKPDIPSWKTDTRITFAGDSIHTMSPSGGSGGETAAADIADLCEALSKSWKAHAGWDTKVLEE